jgi:hypothetical protein
MVEAMDRAVTAREAAAGHDQMHLMGACRAQDKAFSLTAGEVCMQHASPALFSGNENFWGHKTQ